MSWFRCEVDGHERRVLYLRERGLKLDPDTARDDLRVWQDRVLAPGSRTRMPSSADLAERWGWSKTSAYRLLTQHEQWSDPSRLPAWRAWLEATWNDRGTTAERQRNDDGTIRLGATPGKDEARNDDGTTAERPRNESGHTRVVDPPSPSPSPSQEEENTRPASLSLLPVEPKADGWDEVARVYADVYRPALKLRATSKLIRSKGIGLELARMTREHGPADVVEVLRYIATATDDRPGGATFYREKQVAIESVRRHFVALLDKARNPVVSARASPLARGEWVDTRTPEQREAADREADRLLAEWR